MSWLNNSMSHDNRNSFGQVQGHPQLIVKKHMGPTYLLLVLGTLFAIMMLYVSSHYAAAFAQSNANLRATMESIDKKFSGNSVLNSAANIATDRDYKRVYLRPDQGMRASYILPEGSVLTITISQCKNKPVLEVFTCEAMSERNVYVKDKIRGHTLFNIVDPGFYYFSQTVTHGEDASLLGQSLYSFDWNRV